jgi:hypothetical protein
MLLADLAHIRRVVMQVAEHEAHLSWQVLQQRRGELVVGDIGRRELSGEWDPDAGNGADQVQLPAIDPSVPAAVGPVGLGVDAGVRHHALSAVLGMPDAAPHIQHSRVDGNGAAGTCPWLELVDQAVTQAAELGGQRLGQSTQAPLPGAAARPVAILAQQGADLQHLGGGLIQNCQQLTGSM